MAKKFIKKPFPPKIKIIKHGSGYQVFEGKTKVQPTSTLSRSIATVRSIEKDHKQKIAFWVKHRRRK